MRSNRGVAGIDGTVSTAIGAALAHDPGRTVALLGDLTFVHDASGLLIGPTEPTPRNLTIVVSNDNGGGIFELLEQGDPRFADVSSRIFGTPHDVDVGALCRAYHVDARQIEVDELARRARRTARRDARPGGQGRPLVPAAVARRDPGGPVIDRLATVLGRLVAAALPRRDPGLPDTAERKVLRWAKIAVWIVMGIVTLQSVLLVAGAWRNDRQIERHLGTAEAEVLSAGPRRSTIEFVTPDRVTYRPGARRALPVGARRPACASTSSTTATTRIWFGCKNRNALLAIIPAGSIAVVGWSDGRGAAGASGAVGERLPARPPKRDVHL